MSDAVTHLNAALEGRYSIERELGEGGMATVYLAADLKHERKVAPKVLKEEATDSPRRDSAWAPRTTVSPEQGAGSRGGQDGGAGEGSAR